MGFEQKDIKYTTVFGQKVALGQHEKLDESMVVTGEKEPLPVKNNVFSVNSAGTVVESNVSEYRGLSTDTKPNNVALYSTFLEMDTSNVFYYNGTSWVVM